MSDSAIAPAEANALALAPSYVVAQTDNDTDIDDLVPGVDWLSASGKDGRFYDEEKKSIGEQLRVVVLHAAPGQTAWAPKEPEKADQEPHPDLEFFRAIGIAPGKPWCKNRDTKRQNPSLHEDVTPAQVLELRKRGYTGACAGCPFKKWAKGIGPVCRETRELLMVVKGREAPARLTVDGTSLGPLKKFFTKEFKTRIDGKLANIMLHTRSILMGFKSETNEKGSHFVQTFEANAGFLPPDQAEEFGLLREVYLAYSAEQGPPPQHHDEHADFEAEAEPSTPPGNDSPPPPTDDDAPPEATDKGRFDEDPAKAAAGYF